MAAYVELIMDQGSDFNNVVTLTDDISNISLNISGYTTRSQMRRSYYSVSPSANITCTITNADVGEITMSMTAANTSLIKAGRYLFDLEIIDRDGLTSRILEGIVTVTPQITR